MPASPPRWLNASPPNPAWAVLPLEAIEIVQHAHIEQSWNRYAPLRMIWMLTGCKGLTLNAGPIPAHVTGNIAQLRAPSVHTLFQVRLQPRHDRCALREQRPLEQRTVHLNVIL